MTRIAVVGGGISGLSLGFWLAAKGAEVTVLEASPQPGGVIRTGVRDGFVVETAANGYLDREPATARLVEELGLGPRLRRAAPAAKKRFLYTRGRVREVPSSPPAFLASDVLPWSAKLRMALEPLSRRGSRDDESLADFARRHLGRRATAVLVDAVQTGVFAGDVERLSAGAAFPKLRELERRHRSLLFGLIAEAKAKKDPALTGVLTSFDGGMQTLTDALAARLGPRLRTGAPVRALHREGPGWRLTLDDGEVDADRVVLALPAHAAADLVRPHSEDLAQELLAIEYAPVASAHLGYRALPHPPEGFGVLVPAEEDRALLGALHVSSFFPHRAPPGATLLTLMLGGARRPGLVSLPEDELLALARAEARDVLGVDAAPDFVQVIRWQRAIPQYNLGHLARLERVERHLEALPGLLVHGSAFRGVGVNDCVRASERLAAAK